MILRRLATALRNQDWFTVAVETLIVVFGVFVGLQVNNWNDANASGATERQLLSHFQTDVEAAVILKTEWLAEIQDHRKLLIEAIDIVQNKPEQQTIGDGECRAMWSSHLIFYPVAPLRSLDEILSKGNLQTSQGQAVRRALMTYRDDYEVIEQLNMSLTGLANLGDTYSTAFPRRLTQTPEAESSAREPTNEQAARLTDATFDTACRLDVIRADQTIQNKLLSNLARTDGVLQRVRIELSALEHIMAILVQARP